MTAGFFAVYFLFLYHPIFPVTQMPITPIDRFIQLRPNSLVLYSTLWLYIPLGSWFLTDKRELYTYSAALCGLGAIGLAVFFFWPTSVPRVNVDLVAYPGFKLLVIIDQPRNVFPCLHGAFAVFSAICIGRLLRRVGDRGLLRTLNWCWCISIFYSTLATKQHMAVDLFSGIVLGAVWAGIYLRFFTWPQGESTPAMMAVHEDVASPIPQRQ
jgi:hypothetical protein